MNKDEALIIGQAREVCRLMEAESHWTVVTDAIAAMKRAIDRMDLLKTTKAKT
jgi:hypothetical protein